MKKVLILFIISMFTFACSKGPTVDGSSDTAYKASMEKIEKSLNKKELLKFKMAMVLIEGNMKRTHKDKADEEIRKFLNGKSAKEVFNSVDEAFGKRK